MNNIITIHNPSDTCPVNSNSLGDRFAIISEKKMNSSVGEKLQSYDNDREFRSFKFCEHSDNETIPKNSMFGVRNQTCPNNSIRLGTINFFDSTTVNSNVSV